MVAKSVVEIDVNDDKFVSFLDKFNEYQKALEGLPEQWRVAAVGIGQTAQETDKARVGTEAVSQAFNDGVAAIGSLNEGIDRLNGSLEKANKTQSDLNKKTSAGRAFLNKASKDAKSLAGHLKDATSSILSWGAVLGIFSGLAGGGGLLGMGRLAGSASAQRFTAMGLGTTAGGLNSSAVNFQKVLGNPVSTLGAIRDSQMDLSKRWQFQAMGINNPDQDPAKLLPQMIKSARDIFVRNGSNQQGAEAYGLTNYFSLDDLNRFKKMSDAEIDAMTKQAGKDSQRLAVTDKQLQQWQDFNVQLDRSKVSIGNTFIRGLAPLAPQLGKLSDAFSTAVDTVLKSPELGKWIDGLSDGLKDLSTYVSSGDARKDFDKFMTSIRDMGVTVDNVVKFLKGDTINDWMKTSEDSANATADWIKDKTGIDTRTVGPAVTNFVSGTWGQIKNSFASGDVTSVDPTPADVNAKGRTIADRFNNPANLRAASGYGTANTKSGKFAVFPTLDEGVLAAAKQLQIYGSRGINNIHDIVGKWAPPNENNTQAYIQQVVKATGRSENESLNLSDPKLLAKLISAMSVKEGAGSRVSEEKVIQIFNNTGGNAIVTSTQLGGFG